VYKVWLGLVFKFLTRVKVKVKASRKYDEEFVRELEKSVKDIVEGRVRSYEELFGRT